MIRYVLLLACFISSIAAADVSWINSGDKNAYDFHLELSKINYFSNYDSTPWGHGTVDTGNATIHWQGSTPIKPGEKFTLKGFNLGDLTAGTALIEAAYWTDKNHNKLYDAVDPIPEPETYAMMLLGLSGIWVARRYKSKK